MVTNVKLRLITKRAREDKSVRFNNLMHQVNEFSLQECYYMLKKNKAPGIDGETVEEYGRDLQKRIAELLERMKQMSYRPKAVKRAYIPKADGKKRPLGIPAVEDKLVQMMFTRILGSIYEVDFMDFSYGFRSGRNCHQALKKLHDELTWKPVNYVIDADIKGFFDNVDHNWMKKFLEQRISDRKFLRYIIRFLKSGVMEECKYIETDSGTPQGGIVSPVLANVYLHYALDTWFEKEIKEKSKGYVFMIRYADDFVIGVEREEEARLILEVLRKRIKRFGLELAENKTRTVKFGKKWDKHSPDEKQRPGTFNFLGFTHYCSRNHKGNFKTGRRTEKKRYNKAVKKCREWIKQNRHCDMVIIWDRIKQMIVGHYRYYGVSENSRKIAQYKREIEILLFKWLNRRSHKKSFTWDWFYEYLKKFPLPAPRLYHSFYNSCPWSEQ
jgi:group II intron reverse transcriptase/maturase